MEGKKWCREVKIEDKEINSEATPVSFKMPRHQNSKVILYLLRYLFVEGVNKCMWMVLLTEAAFSLPS